MKTPQIDRQEFGLDLANRVADALDHEGRFFNSHRDYCGIGLYKPSTVYVLCEVFDGTPDETLLKWDSRDDFVEFLQRQSDYSLSRVDESVHGVYTDEPFKQSNQTITRAWLEGKLDDR